MDGYWGKCCGMCIPYILIYSTETFLLENISGTVGKQQWTKI
jgi:hypothetical protein